MFKNLIGLSLATTVIISSLGDISYAQKPLTSLRRENNITQTELEKSVPSIITKGFEEFCSKNGNNPIQVWAESSVVVREAIEENGVREMTNVMFKDFLGKCINYSVIDSIHLTEKTQIVYVLSEHENYPLFWEITVYENSNGWSISGFNFNTDAGQILPPSLIIRK